MTPGGRRRGAARLSFTSSFDEAATSTSSSKRCPRSSSSSSRSSATSTPPRRRPRSWRRTPRASRSARSPRPRRARARDRLALGVAAGGDAPGRDRPRPRHQRRHRGDTVVEVATACGKNPVVITDTTRRVGLRRQPGVHGAMIQEANSVRRRGHRHARAGRHADGRLLPLAGRPLRHGAGRDQRLGQVGATVRVRRVGRSARRLLEPPPHPADAWLRERDERGSTESGISFVRMPRRRAARSAAT